MRWTAHPRIPLDETNLQKNTLELLGEVRPPPHPGSDRTTALLPFLPQHLDPAPDLPSLAQALTHSRGEEISTRCQGACIQGGS